MREKELSRMIDAMQAKLAGTGMQWAAATAIVRFELVDAAMEASCNLDCALR